MIVTLPEHPPVPAAPAPGGPALYPGSLQDCLAHAAPVMLCAIVAGQVVCANARYRRIFSSAARVGPFDFLETVIAEDRAVVAGWLQATQGRDGVLPPVEFRALAGPAGIIDCELNACATTVDGVPALVAHLNDITVRKRTETDLSHIAFHDALTGLPNRALLRDRFCQALVAAQRDTHLVGIIVADLDGFKQINDLDGHLAGDMALREVAARLRGCTRDADTLARLGGDEFVAILPRLGDRQTAAVIAGRMLHALQRPVVVDGRARKVGISLGISIFPDDGGDVDTLFSRADEALYRCKSQGKNRYAYAASSGEVVLAIRPLEWDERHETGYPEIDAQHRGLVVLINRIAEGARRGRGLSELGAELLQLVAATERHFSDEECIMQAAAYPYLEQHRAQHHALLEELTALSTTLDAQSLTLTVRHLYEWLFEHIDTYDRALSHYCCRGG